MWNYVVQRMVDEYKFKEGMAWLIQKDGVLGNKYASHGEFVGAIGERIENASKGREDASLGRKFWEWASPEFSKLFTKEEQ